MHVMLRCIPKAFSNVVESVTQKIIFASSARVSTSSSFRGRCPSPYSLFNLQNYAYAWRGIIVTAKLFGCFHFALFHDMKG